MGLPTPSLFAPSEHLIGGCRIDAVFTGKRLNGLSLMFQPGLGLCSSTDSGHSSKPFKFVQQRDECVTSWGVPNRIIHPKEWNRGAFEAGKRATWPVAKSVW